MVNARILVVEDESIVAMGIKSKLENLGHTVVDLASSGEESIEKAAEWSPDLILMDIVLKGDMDGIEAAQQIINLFDIPIIYLTAYADEAMLKRAMITEPYAYILKPFKESELNANIEMALYKHKADKKRRESTKKRILADFYDFVLSAMPTSTSQSETEMREMLLHTFEERLKEDMKPGFDKEMEDLGLDVDMDDPLEIFDAYISWVSKLYSSLGIKTKITPKEPRFYLEFINCPWIDEAKKNPVFCLNCQAMINQSLNWTRLEGNVEKMGTIKDGSPTCMFKFYIPSSKGE
ncbi:MAG: response regulator [Euryarchaeota archaeon]|nr:response regulator [Euryarchaeota archaeon]